MIGKNTDAIQMNADTIKQYHNTNRYQIAMYLQSMITKMSTEDTDMLDSNQVDNPELWIKRKIRQLLRQTGN